MLAIRLTRKGKKNQPFFRVIVTDKRNSPKGGRPVEILGYVDPLTKKKSLKKERILHWLSKGAKPSETIYNLLIKEKVIEGKKIDVAKKSKKPTVSAETAKAALTAPSAELPPKEQSGPESEKLAENPPAA